MGTKTVDGAGPGAGAKTAEPVATAAGSDGKTETEVTAASAVRVTEGTADSASDGETADASGRAAVEATDDVSDEATAETEGQAEQGTAGPDGPTGVGQGAAAVVSAGLGLVSLTGGWIGTVASARENLIGQLQTSSSASVAKQVKEIYGDAWHTTALWAGLFALVALITAVVVLARPAFGTPGRPQAAWIKSVAWAGVSLGVIGLLLAVLKYSDALLALPSTS